MDFANLFSRTLNRTKGADRFERGLIVIGAFAFLWAMYGAYNAQTLILVDCSDPFYYSNLLPDVAPYYESKFECFLENVSRLAPIDEFLWRFGLGGAVVAGLLVVRWVWRGS